MSGKIYLITFKVLVILVFNLMALNFAIYPLTADSQESTPLLPLERERIKKDYF
jgi:hypothetical protein